jgi:2-dehydropantoate 2-reductase
MKIAMVGAGAMGSIFGAAFLDAGVDTVFVDVSAPLVEKLQTEGLVLVRDGEERTLRVTATTDPASVGTVDAAVVLVKGYHTEPAAELIRPLVGPATLVVSLQNGWGNGDILAQHFEPSQIVDGVTYHSATVIGPGRVAHTNAGPTYVGPYAGAPLDTIAALAEPLARAGFAVEVVEEIRTRIWRKLVHNCATLPTSALTRMIAVDLARHEAMLALVDAITVEAAEVGRAAGYDLDPEERVTSINTYLAAARPGKPSMLQDVENGRRTEIDFINGAIVKTAREHGVPAPLNDAMVSLVKGLESAGSFA